MPALRLYKTLPKLFRNTGTPPKRSKEIQNYEKQHSKTPATQKLQQTNMSIMRNSLFMTLPLELRQRVYDFYLDDFITNTKVFNNSAWTAHRPSTSSDYFQPIIWMHSWYHDTSYEKRGPRIISQGCETPIMPLLKSELGGEALAYLLATKLLVEMEVVQDFQGWATQYLNEAQAPHINIRFMADCRFDVDSVYPNPFYRSREPILLLRVEDEGKSLQVRCKFKLKKETIKKWQDALAAHLDDVKQEGKTGFDGRDILRLLVRLQDQRENVFASCECELDEEDLRAHGHVGFPIETKELRAIFDKKQEYRHKVCSASLG